MQGLFRSNFSLGLVFGLVSIEMGLRRGDDQVYSSVIWLNLSLELLAKWSSIALLYIV